MKNKTKMCYCWEIIISGNSNISALITFLYQHSLSCCIPYIIDPFNDPFEAIKGLISVVAATSFLFEFLKQVIKDLRSVLLKKRFQFSDKCFYRDDVTGHVTTAIYFKHAFKNAII